MRLDSGVATFEMLEHHASEESARKSVESCLRAWELDVALRFGRSEISFEFDGADVIDRDPPPPGTGQVIHAKAVAGAIAAVGSVTVHVTRRGYPQPPRGFVASPDAETMWHRYEGYLDGREPLGSMGYFCLTVLERSAGGRDEAAGQYGISKRVLDTLGRLTTEIGNDKTARKASSVKEQRSHNGAEQKWIEAAVKALIRRAGERAFDPEAPRPRLTMGDLPKLPSS